MPDVKQILRLEDWFDAVVVLGPALAWPDGFANALPVIQLKSTGDAPSHRGGDIPGAIQDGARTIDQVRTLLQNHGIRRPLVIALAPAAAILSQLPTPIKARAWQGGGPDVHCDLDLPPYGPSAAPSWEAAVLEFLRDAVNTPKKLNVLILYHDGFTHIETTREHLAAFANHSHHNSFFLPAAETIAPRLRHQRNFSDDLEPPQAFDFSLFDVVVWHHSLPPWRRLPLHKGDFLAQALREQLSRYDGLKVLLVQDDYENTSATWDAVRETGIDLILTVVPERLYEHAYPRRAVPNVELLTTLTGFVPDAARDLRRHGLPLEERPLHIAYRGRRLPARFGNLTREKATIGLEMRRWAEDHGIPVDIEIDDEHRIYGEDWYRFLGSARATLASESGSNVFDFDGSLAAAEAQSEALDYDVFHADQLAQREAGIDLKLTPPKIFEAILLNTALICFEGEYSGVIQPHEHYIPLKKDFSNIADVFAALDDLENLKAMTDRAYRDVIESGLYSHAAFAQRFDTIIESRVIRPSRAEIICAPILTRRRGQELFEPIVRAHPFEYALNDAVLSKPFQLRQLEDAMAEVRETEAGLHRRQKNTAPDDARVVRRYEPTAILCFEFWRNAGASVTQGVAGAHIVTPPIAWHYSQGYNLDLSGVDFSAEYCWVCLSVRDVKGPLLVCLHNPDENSFLGEVSIPEAAAPQQIFIKAYGGAESMLLMRTGDRDEAARAVVLGVEILAASIYLPEVLSIAEQLAAKPS